MRLAKLTLNGFKSFADATEFSFDEAMIGVVGPNGCGKSNIVDAIRWVLGERSSKSLRGKEMIDVIFAGSASRKPSGMASVTLTFENPILGVRECSTRGTPELHASTAGETPETADTCEPIRRDESASEASALLASRNGRIHRGLPIDTDQVEVERRLYRDGTSQYLINGKRARLRDIRELFLDTGIGADAYSIIEQGKVDAMLLASPQERRTIFEEAAGIARYKQRRIESERKLQRAEANLAVTREQLAGTERRLRIVKGQAAKARKYVALDSEFRALRMALSFDQYEDLRERLNGLTSQLADLEQRRAETVESLMRAEQRKQDAELDRHELQGEHRRIEEERIAATHSAESAAQRKHLTERALDETRRQIETDAQRLDEIHQKLDEIRRAIARQAEETREYEGRLSQADGVLDRVGADRAGFLEAIAEHRAALSDRRASSLNIERERAALLTSINADEKRAESLREQMAGADQKRSRIGADRLELARRVAEHELSVSRHEAGIERLERELAERDRQAAMLSQGRREIAERVSDLEQRHLRLDGRRQTLHEMVSSGAGLGDGVLHVLGLRDTNDGFAGVIAPLAELLQTESSHAIAVEAALGADLRALLIRSRDDLPPADQLASLDARVTFLAIENEDEPTTKPGADSATSVRSLVHARANERVDAASIGRVLDRLLEGVYLADSVDHALALAADSHAGHRFVTPTGEVVDAMGRVTAGATSDDPAAGVLQRRSELSEIERELESLHGRLCEGRESLRSVDSEAAQLNDGRAALRSELATVQRALVGDQTRLEQTADELRRMERELASLDQERAQLEHRLANIEQDRESLRERAERLERLLVEQRDEIAGLEDQIARSRASADEASEAMTAAKVEAGRVSEQLQAARKEHSRLLLDEEERERSARDLGHHLEQARSRAAQHAAAIEQALEEIDAQQSAAVRLSEMVADIAERLGRADARALDAAERVNAAREAAQRVERDWHSVEVARREIEVKRETLEQRTLEDISLDLEQEYEQYRTMMSGGDVARIDADRAHEDINALRDQIRALGNVNLDAIDEESQLEQRNEDLIRQVADIDRARETLEDLIQRLNVASKQRFTDVFATIQKNFADRDGMFRKLFGGGRAEVRLMPLVKEVDGRKVVTDEIDVLESGIEVIAKPPGKEPRAISQLSGGEKTLTAVALLLSIFRCKPSCFCVLDEVDASLDEANVDRYCQVVREFTTDSHFIVITHNKKTMHAVDRLYGVTMQERGVSKRVTVKFDEHARKADPDRTEHAAEGVGVAEAKPAKVNGTLKNQLSGLRPEDVVRADRAEQEQPAGT